MSALKVGVIGVGHLGQHHARVYADMDSVTLVGVADTDAARAREIAEKHGTTPYRKYNDLLDKVDAVSVATPTRHHLKISEAFLENGCAVLVEKPMTTTLRQARRLVQAAERTGQILQVGHIERFNPAVMAIQKYNITPKFMECHRLSPFSFRSADIGVVFDLMIHDIDIILNLANSPIKKIDALGVNVIGDKEDIANARLVFQNGCVANVTASRVSMNTMRKIRLFSENSYISLDYGKREGVIFKKSPKLTAGALNVDKFDASTIADLKGFLFDDLLNIEHIQMDSHEPLQKELESFVSSVRDGTPPVVTGEHGLRAIETADKILRKINRARREYERQKEGA